MRSLVKIFVLFASVRSAPRPDVIDLGYGLDEKTEFWPGTQRFNVTQETRLKNQGGIPW